MASSGSVPPCGISFRVTASISRYRTAAMAIRKAERAKELRSLAAICMSLCNCSLSPNLPGHLLLFLDAGLFVMFPLADFRKDPGLLALLLETFQYALEGLLFLHSDARHVRITPSLAR